MKTPSHYLIQSDNPAVLHTAVVLPDQVGEEVELDLLAHPDTTVTIKPYREPPPD